MPRKGKRSRPYGRRLGKGYKSRRKRTYRKIRAVLRAVEKKDYFEDPFGGAVPFAITSAAYTYTLCPDLNNIAQGAGKFDRIGDKIDIKWLYLHGLLQTNNAASAQFIRMMLVMWKPGSGDAISTAEVFNEDHLMGGYNSTAAGDKFKVLKDWKIFMNGTPDRNILKFKYFKYFKKSIQVRYEPAGSHKPRFYLVTRSNMGLAVEPQIAACRVRIGYLDL